MPWYSAGTVAVTNNSPTVTGSGTSFSVNARVGDAFRGPDGLWYEVTNVASATVISIKPNYQSANNAAGSYAIAPMQGYVKDSADQLRAFVNQYGTTLASLGPWSTAPSPADARTQLGLGPLSIWQSGSDLVIPGSSVGFRVRTAGDIVFGQAATSGVAPGTSGLPGWYHQWSGGYNQVRSTGAGFMDLYLRSGGATVFNFLPNGVTAGNVTCTATATTYATSSDYRLKDDVQPLDAAEATERVMAYRPVTWVWKTDGSYGKGFIAHECQAVDPMTATGTKDAVEQLGSVVMADGTVAAVEVREPEDPSIYGEGATWEMTGERPVYQGRDDSKMIPDMIAMMQRMETRIRELEAQLQQVIALLPAA